MCRLASFLFQPRTMEVRVADLNSHERTHDILGLRDDGSPSAWREGHYLPDGTVSCAVLDQDPVMAEQAASVITARWPTFERFFAWACLTATHINASGCTSLTSIEAPVATWLYASGCTALTSIEAPAAQTLDVRGCAGLTDIRVPPTCRISR